MLPPTRARSLLIVCLLALWGVAAPAIAGVRADFDHDGLIDTATIVSGAHPHIEIALSGTDRFLRLPLKDHLFSLVAADIDHDGYIDLAGASSRRGLLVWKNRGGRRFAPRRRPALGPRALGGLVLTPQHQARHDWPFSEDGIDPTTIDQQIQAPAVVASGPSRAAVPSTRLRLVQPIFRDTADSRPAASRAPPRPAR